MFILFCLKRQFFFYFFVPIWSKKTLVWSGDFWSSSGFGVFFFCAWTVAAKRNNFIFRLYFTKILKSDIELYENSDFIVSTYGAAESKTRLPFTKIELLQHVNLPHEIVRAFLQSFTRALKNYTTLIIS